MRNEPALWLAAWGSAAFWGLSSLLGQNVLVYAKSVLALPDQWRTIPLGIYAVGIGIGSVTAGRISGGKVETGLIALGAIGLAALTLFTGLTQPGIVGLSAVMALLGVCSGFVLVPLDSLLQWLSPADRRGAVISLANVFAFGGMLIGSLLGGELAARGLSSTSIWTAAGALTVLGTIWALRTLPVAFLRLIVFFYTHTLYRVTVRGAVHVPAKGGVLLTPNHLSTMDGLYVTAALDRPVRFVMDEEQFNRPLLKPFLKLAGAIPVSANGSPKMILRALRAASEALDNGEVVCIFPEGQITRTGAMLQWRRGFERILKGRDHPIVPVHLDRVWGSKFSHGRRRREFPQKVTVSFGESMPATTPLHRVRQAVVDLESEAWALRKRDAQTLGRSFLGSVRRAPWKLALADGQRELTRLQAAAGAVALARALRPHWAGQRRVGVLLPACVPGTLVNAAAMLAGREVVNLNWTAGIESPIRQAGIESIVTTKRLADQVPAGVRTILVEELEPARLAAAAMLLLPKRWIESYCGAARKPRTDDTATVIFSSGSTGEPKGVLLSHWNLGSNIEALAQVMRMNSDDRLLNVLPAFHSFGTMLTWFGLTQGIPQVLHPDPMDARSIGALVEKHRVTIALATPTFLQFYIRRVPPEQFGSLRLLITGAEKLRESTAREFEDRFGIRPMEAYGATECSPGIAVSLPSFRDAGFFQEGSRRGSVGLPLPGVTLRVVDPETHAERSPGEPGLLLVKGPNVMIGYLGREPIGEWYETGDIAIVEKGGFVRITDRLSRFSKIGGEMVPHGKVEEALETAYGEPGERHFFVTGVPDKKKGERLVVLHTTEQGAALLDQLELPNLFLPRANDFIHIEKMPLLGTGKLDLKKAKSLAAA
ncbi:MAG: AMP-binding protein [Planctomycetota bacterium]|jgi:acyl-[acyl-carrier-protein]-phospholipid O-acyltransferase/long-chain-fatty-acid--[acyl-carrier-protein] ligase